MSDPNKPPNCPKHGTRMRFVAVVTPFGGRRQCEWRCAKCRRVYRDAEIRELSRLKEAK